MYPEKCAACGGRVAASADVLPFIVLGETVEVRRSFAMSQVAFEELLGVGPKTVV
ncbi:MAG: hypothetical protein Q7J82_01630 [Coriobacteriia bacterium]|nr:hypothetical protein [Coriobacteriia bacterium]